MAVKKLDILITIKEGEQTYVNLKWLRGASRYNNGGTLYKGKYQFRFLIGSAKQVVALKSLSK